jgi:multidrug resistance efflux pump
MKSAILFLTFVIAGGAFAFWIAGALPPIGEEQKQITSRPRSPVSGQTIYGVGFIEPSSEIRKLTFKIDGVIASCPVLVGQSVKAGDVLCELRNEDEHAAIVVAEQELALAKADRDKLLSGVHPSELEAAKRRISALEVKLKFYQQRYKRESGLVERQVSTEEALEEVTSELDETTEKLEEAKADLNRLQTFVRAEDRTVAAARVQLAAANLDAAKARFNDTVLRAPIDGTVLEILKRDGEAVRIYDPTPVLVFGDCSKLRVRAEFDERFVNDITVGQTATLFGRGFRDHSVTGRVTLMKTIMGKKTVFSRESAERKDLEVLQVFIDADETLDVPIGLKVDVQLAPATPAQKSTAEVVKLLPKE